MAAGYARNRPAVHPLVIKLAEAYWQRSRPIAFALDVGCGSGLSTRALRESADRVIGIDPAEAMVKLAATVVAGAHFAVAAAEDLPVSDASIDLLTAAGSLNYVELGRFFAEAQRVLAPEGMLLVYDFGPGRHFVDGPELDEWFSRFVGRYPWPPEEALAVNPALLAEIATGFSLEAEQFEVAIPLSPVFYCDYMMTETNVACAVRAGIPFQEIRAWCLETLLPMWGHGTRDVLFRGYFACMRPLASKHNRP